MGLYNRVSISGKIASGKTTISDRLNREYGFEQIRSAYYLKELCAVMVQMNLFELSGNSSTSLQTKLDNIIWKLSNSREEFDSIKIEVTTLRETDFSHVRAFQSKDNDYRGMLQRVAEILIEKIDGGIFVNSILGDLAPDKKYVHDDLRYPFEFARLRKEGFILIRLEISQNEQMKRIKRLYGKIDPERVTHISETSLDESFFDYYIDATLSEDEVFDKVKEILKLGGE